MNNMNFDDLKNRLNEIVELCDVTRAEWEKECRKRPLTINSLCSHCENMEKCSLLFRIGWRISAFVKEIEEMTENE